MKNRDLLSTAIEAMRASDESAGEFAATRARVLQTVHTKRLNRQRLVAALIVLGCVSVGSSAWAAVTGRLPTVLHALGFNVSVDAPEVRTQPSASITSTSRRHVVRSQVVDPSPTAPPSTLPPAFVETPALQLVPTRGVSLQHVSRHSHAVVQAEQATEAEQPLRVDPADALYREAHEAHFQAHDSSLALTRWEAYLQTAPQGRFVPEAQYNRAICLVRLGRNAEAIDALRVIEARTDGYRVHEAHELLEVLTRR